MNKEILYINLCSFSYLVFCYLSIKLLLFKREAITLKKAVRALFYNVSNPEKLNFTTPEINSIWNSVYSLNFKNKNSAEQNSIYNDILNLGSSITSTLDQSKKVSQTVSEIILNKITPDVSTVAILKYNQENDIFAIDHISGIIDKRIDPIIIGQIEDLFSKSKELGDFNSWGYNFTTSGEKFDLSPLGINLSLAIPLETNNILTAVIWLGFRNHTAILNPEKAALIKGISEHCAASLTVSERVRNNIELHQQERDIFLGVSHDLRMPGNCALHALSELEETFTRANKKQKNLLNILKNSLGQQLEIIDNVLDLSRKQAGVLKANKVRIDLNSCIKELFVNFAVYSNKNVKFICEEVPNIEIDFDPLNFRRIIANLLSNAFKFTKCGEVRIKFIEDSKIITIQIADTGVGILENDIPSLFKKYMRLENSRKIEGTGLGLSNAYSLSELNNASLSYTKNYPQGSIFNLSIPIISSSFEKKVFFQKILVVDDDSLVCRATTRYLREYSDQILTSSNCEEAINILQAEKIDLLISDINLGNTTIEMILDYLLKESLNIPIVLISGDINQQIIEKCKEHFNSIFLQKPISRSSMVAGLNCLI